MSQSVVDVALGIAASGPPVFPCGNNKKPCIKKEDGGNGFKDAVSDPDAIRALFARTNARLVGVPTGETSGFDALDFDYVHGAADWEREHGHKLPKTRTHRTKSGGKHLLFQHAPGVRNLASKFAPGMDVRGDGGYVIMPPSRGYALVEDAPIAEWPQWLLEIVISAPPKKEVSNYVPIDIASKRLDAFVKSVLDGVRAAPEGRKHFTLRNAALSLGGIQAAAGLSESQLTESLIDALPKTAKDIKGARATVAWGLEQGRKRPVVLPDRERYAKLNGHSVTSAKVDPRPEPPPFDGYDPDNPFTKPAPPRSILVLGGERHKAADAGLAALAAADVAFYQRDKSLVRAALTKAKSSDGRIVSVPGIVPVTIPILGRELGRVISWEKAKKDGELYRIDPPKEVVEQIASMVGHWPFAPLAGVIGTPTLRPDGSLLLKEGYDEATGLYLMSPPTMPTVPEKPTRKQAEEAFALLADLLVEFPFADAASRSVAMSMMQTPVLRGALAPAVPMHVVTAPQPGTGKSYLQDTAAVIATGERCAVLAFAPKEDETEKRLIGAALSGFPIIAIDNVNGLLTGNFLAQVTSSAIMLLRPLGSSTTIRLPNAFSVFANGNNILVTADLVRRTAQCALDSDLENPEDRQFRSNPVATIMADRGKYVAACLTIARAYITAGTPDLRPRLAGFEAWSDLVRSAIVWLGWPDPVASMDLARADDPTRQARMAFFESWAAEIGIENVGFTTAELIDKAMDYYNGQWVRPEFRSACLTVGRDRAGTAIAPDRLGKWLRGAANQRSGQFKLLVDRRDEKRPRWVLQSGRINGLFGDSEI